VYVPGGIHHSVVVVRDLEVSLRFYRDGLGLDLLQDRQVEGDWPDLFGAPSRHVRAVFLGDAGRPDDHAGVLEFNVFDGDIPEGAPPSLPRTGSFCCRSSSTSRPRWVGLRRSASGVRRSASLSRRRTGLWPWRLCATRMGCLSCSPPVRLPGARNELTARLQARHHGRQPSPPRANNAAICAQSKSHGQDDGWPYGASICHCSS
jgi:catechol 2,3-dioxygenase-like lactoylglutathione lyase family enzyme